MLPSLSIGNEYSIARTLLITQTEERLQAQFTNKEYWFCSSLRRQNQPVNIKHNLTWGP